MVRPDDHPATKPRGVHVLQLSAGMQSHITVTASRPDVAVRFGPVGALPTSRRDPSEKAEFPDGSACSTAAMAPICARV